MSKDYIAIVKKIVLEHVPLNEYAVFLFGSRAAGNAHEMSDIDIGILGKEPLNVVTKLDLEEFLEESIVPYHIDVIDFFSTDSSFRKEALSRIQIWNCPKNISLS
ncbi:MAG TPA: nucleotidyltransferase domain-containing protein [Sphingobacteriaceae bacterium]|nr:nucleotidyltransferase domain-containing protein [Sphingobacteriaceae bacterium]